MERDSDQRESDFEARKMTSRSPQHGRLSGIAQSTIVDRVKVNIGSHLVLAEIKRSLLIVE
jgi:hypothetical protein